MLANETVDEGFTDAAAAAPIAGHLPALIAVVDDE
jgi:hypothetical protein